MGLLGQFLGSTLGAVGGKVGSGFIDGFVGDFFNKKQEQRAFDRNVEMWNMENQYNSPQAQMQRYKDAGLNPNLVYNSLGGSTNIGSVGMANNSVDTSNSNYANPYYHYMNLKNRQYEDAVKNQQLAKMENENKLLTEKIETEKSKRVPPQTVGFNENKEVRLYPVRYSYGIGPFKYNGVKYMTYDEIQAQKENKKNKIDAYINNLDDAVYLYNNVRNNKQSRSKGTIWDAEDGTVY